MEPMPSLPRTAPLLDKSRALVHMQGLRMMAKRARAASMRSERRTNVIADPLGIGWAHRL